MNLFSIVTRRNVLGFFAGGIIATLGGLIGLGGAEFRLPVLISGFKFPTLHAITFNLVVSLVTVTFSFLFRAGSIPFSEVMGHSELIVNLLVGSLTGSFLGVQFATRLPEKWLTRAIALLLVCLSFILIGHDFFFHASSGLDAPVGILIIIGLVLGIGIGIVSSMLGVAGGELIIPTLVLVYGINIKLAGSLSLAISFPTILLGLFRYWRKGRLTELRNELPLLGFMAVGSILGALVGSSLVSYISPSILEMLLGIVLLVSAIKLVSDSAYQSKHPNVDGTIAVPPSNPG